MHVYSTAYGMTRYLSIWHIPVLYQNSWRCHQASNARW